MVKGDDIPNDIIVDLLSKLPSRSILRFKIACKTWYSLISNPIFINLHSKRTSQNPKILFSTGFRLLQILDYENPSFDDSCLSDPIKFPGKTSLNHVKIIGSSMGLVCVATDYYGNKFSILNPLTRECRKLPNLSTTKSYKLRYFHGLGYDSVANDFKLVIWNKIRCNIFSLKANSWKRIKWNINEVDFEYQNVPTLATIFLNGILYWVVVPSSFHHLDQNTVPIIVTFDVAKETFEKLQFPEHEPWKSCSRVRLFDYKGCLCLFFSKHGSYPPVNEIWMMKEYGAWVHLLTINKNSRQIDIYSLPILCISTRDEVVCHAGKKFSRSRRGKEDEIIIQQNVYGAVLYFETLVSPN